MSQKVEVSRWQLMNLIGYVSDLCQTPRDPASMRRLKDTAQKISDDHDLGFNVGYRPGYDPPPAFKNEIPDVGHM